MSDFTEQEFNLAMRKHSPNPLYPGFMAQYYNMEDELWGPFSDINQLLPIAWKFGVLTKEDVLNSLYCPNGSYEETLAAIRQCLWQIHMEGKHG